MGQLFTPNSGTQHISIQDASEVCWEDVADAQLRWADAIVDIGRAFQSGSDFRTCAEAHLLDLYAFETGPVLFKPTLASEQAFRTTFHDALSYFVGGSVAEDQGFALRPWSKVEFGDRNVMFIDNGAFAMGDYVFTPLNRNEAPVRVEYTFGYIRDADGALRICVHQSSLPYQPEGGRS